MYYVETEMSLILAHELDTLGGKFLPIVTTGREQIHFEGEVFQ